MSSILLNGTVSLPTLSPSNNVILPNTLTKASPVPIPNLASSISPLFFNLQFGTPYGQLPNNAPASPMGPVSPEATAAYLRNLMASGQPIDWEKLFPGSSQNPEQFALLIAMLLSGTQPNNAQSTPNVWNANASALSNSAPWSSSASQAPGGFAFPPDTSTGGYTDGGCGRSSSGGRTYFDNPSPLDGPPVSIGPMQQINLPTDLESRSKALQINQFSAERQAGGPDGSNQNCGPTSLAMALRAVGIDLPGKNDGFKVLTARQLMSKVPGSRCADGIDQNGRFSNAENSTGTGLRDIAGGGKLAGANTRQVGGASCLDEIKATLQRGGSAIAFGDFTGKSPLPWTGDGGGGKDFNSAPGGAHKHFVAVTAFVPPNSFVVNDPCRSKPICVSAATLDHFMKTDIGKGAILVENPKSNPAPNQKADDGTKSKEGGDKTADNASKETKEAATESNKTKAS